MVSTSRNGASRAKWTALDAIIKRHSLFAPIFCTRSLLKIQGRTVRAKALIFAHSRNCSKWLARVVSQPENANSTAGPLDVARANDRNHSDGGCCGGLYARDCLRSSYGVRTLLRISVSLLGSVAFSCCAWSLERVEVSERVFRGCQNIVLGDGTTMNALAVLKVSVRDVCGCVAEAVAASLSAEELAAMQRTDRMPDRFKLPSGNLIAACAEKLSP